ncbi:MAG: glycine betaine catabolism [Patescibacteria group bacterium]|nr:glycine betaine catabolism [Patescibacteria group bacterium]
MNVQFEHSVKIAEDIYSFYFSHPAKLRYVAGQFIELTLDHPDVDDRGNKRWFTLSSSPSEELLCITTKVINQCSSFKKALSGLRPGDRVMISESMGDFILPKDSSIPLVFIAGGIGITPFRSMIQWLADTGSSRDIQLLYFAPDKAHVAFGSMLEQPFTSVEYITDGTKLTADEINTRVDDLVNKYVYISGPEPMTEAVVAELLQLGIHKHQLVTDYFPGYISY